MTFRSSISTGKPEQLLSLMCFFFSGFLKSDVVYAADDDLTYNSSRFKKPLNIFGPQIKKKTMRNIFSYDFGC